VLAVAHHFGIGRDTVWRWPKALGVPAVNEGTRRLHREWMPERLDEEDRQRAVEAANTPEANAKKAAAVTGRQPSPKQLAALASGRKRTRTPKARRKRSASHKARGTIPPAAGVPWTAAEDALLGTMPDEDVAKKTGRTLCAVEARRQLLRIRKY